MAGQSNGIPLAPVAVAAFGGLVVYASLTGRSFLQVARDLLSGKTPTPLSKTSGNPVPSTSVSNALGVGGSGPTIHGIDYVSILAAAKAQIGKPYAWSKANPYDGFDCSGLVNWVIGHDMGYQLPGDKVGAKKFDGQSHGPVVAQWLTTSLCTTMEAKYAQPGDLVIWGTSHIGFYNGNGTMVDAPDLGQLVKIEKVWSPPTPIYRRYVGSPELRQLLLTLQAQKAGPVTGKLQ
jgi:hypothetical protein